MNSISRQYFTTFAVATLVHLVCFIGIGVFYNTNDDVGMALIAKGYFTGSPDEHLVFMNTCLGYVLKGLYHAIPAVEWYSILLVGLQFFAIVAIARILHSRTTLLSRVAFWVVSAYLILNLQFTNVAYLSLMAGLLILVTRNKQAAWWKYAVGVAFVVMAFLVRLDAVAVGIFVSLPFLWKREKRFLVAAASVFVLCGLAFLIHLNSYASGQWRDFQEYNLVRGALNDNPNLAVLADDASALAKLGITKDELELFNNATPVARFDKALLGKIYDEVKLPQSPGQYAKNLLLSYNAALLFLALVFLAFYNRSQYNKVKVALGLFCIINLLICLNHYPKDRVTFDLLLLVFFLALVSSRGFSKKPLQWASGVFLVFFAVMAGMFAMKINPDLEFKAPPQTNVVPLYANYRTYFGRVRPFSMPATDDRKVMAASWLVNSPVQLQQYHYLGISADAHFSPLENKDVNEKLLFVADTTKASRDFVDGPVKRYLETQKLKTDVSGVQNAFVLYRITSAK